MVTTRNGKSTHDQKAQKGHLKVKKEVKEKEKPTDSSKVISKDVTTDLKSAKSTPKKNAKGSNTSQKSSMDISLATPESSKVSNTTKSIRNSKSPDAPIKTSKSGKSFSKLSIYSEAELAQYKKFKEELEQQKLETLKTMCKSNSVKVSGTKAELCERIADAKVLGVIPKCPSCGGGRPKLDAKSKTYYCPGYLEDVVFKNCHKTFGYAEIVREPWKG